ncbi:MAG TPA: pilus assembly protein N-terminal domain-containing protein [Bryobacteraceae bacterium]|nr:pilus assembly protein N-terminal domain-containing protein [Bryobacteraceae bacterium]
MIFKRIAPIVSFAAAAALAASNNGWAQSGPEDLRLTVGKSIVIDYPSDIGRISTSNADIVDTAPVTNREILIHGKSFGTVTMIVWSKVGQRNFYNITVEQNLAPLQKLLRETFGNEDIHVQSSRDSLSLTGHASSKDVAERAAALATPFAKTIVNNLEIAPARVEKQILLRVKFAELDRDAASQFAVNLLSTGATNTLGRVTTGQFPSGNVDPSTGSGGASSLTISDALNIFAFRPSLNLAALIKALQSRSLLEILAEPNLVTTNGKEALFTVGGEFPVPILQGGANSGAVTVMFKEFGVRLAFNPVVTENHTIKMYIRPEVSTLDFTNAVSLNGFTIPALSTRKMETNIELGEGQSFIIAGLIDNRVTESMARIPGLSSLPIIGNIFKTKDEKKSRTELVVMVTPEITEPLQPGDVKAMPQMPSEFLAPVAPSPEARTEKRKK